MTPLVLLVTSLYLNPNSMIEDKPVEYTKAFKSVEECNSYKEQLEADLKKSLENGLIAYSTKCE